MADELIEVGDGFWNIRGSFKIFGVVDIGTHASLVRRTDGSFVLLDSYPLTGEVERRVLELTDGGDAITAILNVHPFHTIYVRTIHERFPHAKLYGTWRHAAIKPDMPWEKLHTEDPELHAQFADDFVFSVPQGVDFVPDDESLHFASVLVHHPATRTLHVDDTLMYTKIPLFGGVRFHPTLKSVLQKRAGAVAEFRSWCDELVELSDGVDNLCAAHTRALFHAEQGPSITSRVRQAIVQVQSVLEAHEKAWG